MSSKIFLPAIIFSVFTSFSVAQTKLGYYRDLQGGFIFTNYKTESSDASEAKVSGVSIDIRGNYSILGRLIFRDPEKKFFIGDHIGFGFGVGFYNKTSDDVPFMVPFNLEIGAKTCYSINDDLEVGLKFIYAGTNYFTDFKNDFHLSQRPAIIPAVRWKKYMFSAGFGTAKTGDTSDPKGNYLQAEGRLILGDPDDEDSKGFLFFRFENYTGKVAEYGRKDNATQLSLGVGLIN